MRVIAGSARHLPLKTPMGMHTRPTSDKIKETLFNILQNRLYDVRFLDLFAGSGGIGIEALSRGASFAAFVDDNRDAVRCIEENLEFTKFTEQALVFRKDVIGALRSLEKLEPFDIIFMDPPYGKDFEKQVLTYLADSSIVTEDTLLILETLCDQDVSYVKDLGFRITRRKEYKNNMHVFLERAED